MGQSIYIHILCVPDPNLHMLQRGAHCSGSLCGVGCLSDLTTGRSRRRTKGQMVLGKDSCGKEMPGGVGT